MSSCGLVVAGGSSGGAHALGQVLAGLPEGFGAAVAVVLHRGPDSSGAGLVAALGSGTALPVREVEDKDRIVAGCVYLAPAGYHLLVERGTFALSVDAPVHHSRPSIDVLFESAADAYGDEVVGVILTGASRDGAAGLARIKERGGVAVVQDPGTAERREMPEAAMAATVPDAVLSPADIGPYLAALMPGRTSDRYCARSPSGGDVRPLQRQQVPDG